MNIPDAPQPPSAVLNHEQAAMRLAPLFAPEGLAQIMPLAVVAWDADGRILGWNRASEALFGWSADEVLGTTIFDLILPEAQGRMREIAHALLKEQMPLYNIHQNLTRDGSLVLCEWHNTLLRDADGSLLAAVSIARDITRQKQVEQERERLAAIMTTIGASDDLNAILRMVRDAVVEVGGMDRAAVFLYDASSGEVQGTWGTDRAGQEENISHYVFTLQPDDPWPLARVMRGEAPYWLADDLTQENALTPNDAMYGVCAHATLALRVGGNIVGALCADNLISQKPITRADVEALLPFADQAAVAIQSARLITELRQTQDALVSSAKMRAMGELASGVAHNVNNVLAAVLGYAELILDAEGVTPEIAHFARTIERAALDGAEIVRRVQHFARRETTPDRTPFDLTKTAQEAIDLTRPAWRNQAMGRGVTIVVVRSWRMGVFVLGVASEIREALVNLINNAVDAMPSGGTLTVHCRAENGEGMVRIQDTGIGIDSETQRRLFEPFFSTKAIGQGTGLGLSLVWGILDRHHGRIEVESAPGQGATFTVWLPLAEARPEEETTSPEILLSGLRLLLVEDDALVQSGLARMLTARGASVEICNDAVEALQWLAQHSDKCDIVLSDHGMVGMTGMELLDLVRERYPHLRRILLSGWGANLPDTVDLSAADRILTKPIPIEGLSLALRQLGNRPPDA